MHSDVSGNSRHEAAFGEPVAPEAEPLRRGLVVTRETLDLTDLRVGVIPQLAGVLLGRTGENTRLVDPAAHGQQDRAHQIDPEGGVEPLKTLQPLPNRPRPVHEPHAV